MNRRGFLQTTLASGLFTANANANALQTRNSAIRSIRRQILWQNRDGLSQTWFHPRACMLPDQHGQPQSLMTLQVIGGSDYFGPVHYSSSQDNGRSWSEPAAIAAFDRRPVPGRNDGLQAGVCDVVPQYHAATETTLALGHVVFYKGAYFAKKEQLPRYPVYAIRDSQGNWSQRKRLIWDDPRGGFIYSNNCGQRLVLPDGDILLAFTFGPKSTARMVAGVRCRFDGETLSIRQVGPPLTHAVGRGLLEPSLAFHNETYWMTIRAEDKRGYLSTSRDGLTWAAKRPWCWDDGVPLTMSTTQQHWLTHRDALYLVYTRQDDRNRNVIRWRAPLWMAQVDQQKQCLLRDTEQVVIPLTGDGVNAPDHVPLMGNFHVTNASPQESWVTVGEWLPRQKARGNVWLSRIQWQRPNTLPLWTPKPQGQ